MSIYDSLLAKAINGNGGGGGSGGKYDAYDFVITQVDNGTPVLEKGTWQDIYDALQNMDHVVGLFLYNDTPSQWHDTVSLFVPLTMVNYYSSADSIIGTGLYYDTSRKRVTIDWDSDGTIYVTNVSA